MREPQLTVHISQHSGLIIIVYTYVLEITLDFGREQMGSNGGHDGAKIRATNESRPIVIKSPERFCSILFVKVLCKKKLRG